MKCTLDPKSLPMIGSGAYDIMRTQEDEEPEVESEEEKEVKKEIDEPKERGPRYTWRAGSRPADLTYGHYNASVVFDNGMVFGVGPDADVWFYDGEKSRLLDFSATANLKMLEVAKDGARVVCRSVDNLDGVQKFGQNKVLSDQPLPTHVLDGIQYALAKAHRWSVIDDPTSPTKDGHYPRKPLFFDGFGKPLISIDLDSKLPCISTRLVTMPLFFEEKVHLVVRHRCLVPDGQTERTTFDFGTAFIFDLLVLRDGKEIETHTLDIIYDIDEDEASAIKAKMDSWFSTLYAFPRVIRSPAVPNLEPESDSDESDESSSDDDGSKRNDCIGELSRAIKDLSRSMNSFFEDFEKPTKLESASSSSSDSDSDESDDDAYNALVCEALASIGIFPVSIAENKRKQKTDSEAASSSSSSSKETSNRSVESRTSSRYSEIMDLLIPMCPYAYMDNETGYYVTFYPKTLVLATPESKVQIDRSNFERLSVEVGIGTRIPRIGVHMNDRSVHPLCFPGLRTEKLKRHVDEKVMPELTALVAGIQRYILSLK